MDCICGYDFDKVEGDEKNHRRRFQDISIKSEKFH